MGRLFARLRENLARDRRPIPQQRDVNGGRDYVFAHNAASDVVARADPVIVAQAGRSLPDVCSDAPSDTDMIGAVGDVEILADLIAAADTSPPLAIALIGDWGAGKSSVMLQVQRQVDLLAEIARSDPEASAFASNVRQVTFNAWDYSDDRVWCGIIEHLFAALAADPGTAVAPGPDEVRAERVVLRKELAGQEAEEQRLASALRAADRVAPSGFLTGPGSPAYLWRVATVASLELARDMRAVAAVMTWWIVLGAAAYEAWLHWGALIGSVIAVAVAVIAPVSALARQLWRWDQAGLSIAIRLRRSLDERQRAVSRSVADLRERLALIDASARLSAFLRNRVTSGAYQEQGGLVGQVRRDLARLSDDLAGARDEWAAGGSSGPPPLERIVLYIDDLDRCPPQRVVEVLEAVHLMLALELFVVVVAVDVRWLIRSLEFHYRELFNADSAPGEMPGQAQPDAYPPPATPADYLDKIFQIPYVITAPTPGALGLYMQSLLPRPASAAVAPEAARQTSGSADPSEKSDEAPGRDEGMRAADPALSAASPQRLRVSQHEIDFMTRLGPLLSTPRAAKRLVNLYRLVRTGIPHAELAAFTGSGTGGPYQAVQVLLAILVGRPTAAHRVFTEIMCAPPDSDVLSVLADISVELGKIAQQVPLHGHVEEYHRWCPVLARYSFHTRPDQWSR
jgi:hypothetical protein